MKTNPAFLALCLLSVSLPAVADTFTLKDGTTVEGTVISDAGDSYLLEVQVTKSIKDERKILKSDVTKVARERPDSKAFEAIAKLVPVPDFLPADDYPPKISQVEKFLKDFPTSLKVKDATAMLATLKSEYSKISAGGVKMNGKIIPSAEYAPNAYDLDARVMEAKIRRLIADNQLLPALRLFVEFDRDYKTTLSYGALSPVIKQIIQSQVTEAKQSLLTLEARTKARATGLDQMAATDRRATEDAIKEETLGLEARFKAEKEALQNWVTPNPFHRISLEETVRFGEAELARIGDVKTVLGVDGGKAYREVYTAVHGGGNSVAVAAAISAAKTALVPARYLEPLESAAKGRK